MTKIVINPNGVGLNLSNKAKLLYAKKKGINLYFYNIIHVGDDYPQKQVHKKMTDEYLSKCDIMWANEIFTKDFGDIIENLTTEMIMCRFNNRVLFEDMSLRTDPVLIETVEEMTKNPKEYTKNTWCVSIPKIVEIPDDVKWRIKTRYNDESEYIIEDLDPREWH